MKNQLMMIGTIAALGCAGLMNSAQADFVGEPVVVPFDAVEVNIEFLGSEAGWSGELYYLGAGNEDTLLELALDTGKAGLGTKLHHNHDSDAGDEMSLEGVWEAGTTLHFAYDVLTGQQNTFRTDDAVSFAQFSWNADEGILGIEDIKLPGGDHDYNDAVFRVTFTGGTIPGPGALALLSVGAVWRGRRKDRLVDQDSPAERTD